MAADVQTRAGTEALAAAAQEELGGVDVLVHNVGGAQGHKSGLAIPDEVWQDALDLNFLSAVRLNSLLAPGMRDRGSGAIVHVSTAALSPRRRRSCTTRRRRRRWRATAGAWPSSWRRSGSG